MGPITPALTYFFPNGWFRTRQKSAKDVFYASFDEKTLGMHPKAMYLNGSVKAQSSPETMNAEKQRRLWRESVQMTALKQEETVLKVE